MNVRPVDAVLAGLALAVAAGGFAGEQLGATPLDGLIAGGLAFHVALIAGWVAAFAAPSNKALWLRVGGPAALLALGVVLL